jgi:diketogulonate reductase-like aldo/keto reductase
MKPELIEQNCREALADLQLSYLDLWLVHIPVPLELRNGTTCPIRVPLHKVWEQMEALVDKGLVKSIGVSNYTVAQMNDLLAYARIPPVVNQIERHPFLTQGKLFFIL